MTTEGALEQLIETQEYQTKVIRALAKEVDNIDEGRVEAYLEGNKVETFVIEE